MLGKNGVEKIVEFKLTGDKEETLFRNSASAVKILVEKTADL